MKECLILSFILIVMIFYLIYLTYQYDFDCNKNNIKSNIEKWEDIQLNPAFPVSSSCKNSGIDMDKASRTCFSNGYKLEDDKYQCSCQCTRKCKNPLPATTKTPQSTTVGVGYRINHYPWFIPFTK